MDYDKSKVILALDNYSVPMAEEIISRWQSEVWGFKLNHNLYPYIGKNYNNIFCDYKLYDIPNTMCGVLDRLVDDGCEMVTVHMTNNKAAIESLSKYADKIKLLGVSVLTSWNFADIDKVFSIICRRHILSNNMANGRQWILWNDLFSTGFRISSKN